MEMEMERRGLLQVKSNNLGFGFGFARKSVAVSDSRQNR